VVEVSGRAKQPANLSRRAERAGSQGYAVERLRGSVWEHVPLALAAYRGTLTVGEALGRTGISANAITYASLVVAGLAGTAAALGHLTTAAVLVLASGALDMLDGIVARATSTGSRWGALLDSTVDRLSDGLPLLGLVVFFAPHGWLAAVPGLAILGAFTVSYVRARSEALGVVLPTLLMRRAERVVLITASLFAGVVPCSERRLDAPLTLLGIAVLAASSFIAAGVALREARRALSAPGPATSGPSD
jgi:CDP-diacylglycerol--glycerol-3-phosphate 3-phosphatidyltransferase